MKSQIANKASNLRQFRPVLAKAVSLQYIHTDNLPKKMYVFSNQHIHPIGHQSDIYY
jgi:hypothetical protein